MGADGGICWVRVLDRARFNELTGWLAWRFLNQSAQAYKSDYATEPLEPGWLEGGYGTDCETSPEDLCELTNILLDKEPSWGLLSAAKTSGVIPSES